MAPSLAIFAKAPRRGTVKTRLAADLGEEAALAVYRALLQITAGVAAAWPGRVRVHAAGADADWAGSPLATLPRLPQAGDGLAQRLAHGLQQELREAPRAIAIGADCPGLDVAGLLAVAALLDDHDPVFGPATDGGYWALGVGSPRAVAVSCDPHLPWSRPGLLAASEARCAAAGLHCGQGPRRADLDTSDDLSRAESAGFCWTASG